MSGIGKQLGYGTSLLIALCAVVGCDVWKPPEPTTGETDRGLVVMYPGAMNTHTEMLGFYLAARLAGVDRAIEIVPWAPSMSFFLNPSEFSEWLKPWATIEADRIAAYQDAHPGAPVALLGYSAGTMVATIVTEQMSPGHEVENVVLMSPGMKADYDLTLMLSKTRDGAVVYWSPRDQVTISQLGPYAAFDAAWARPAAAFGFDLQDVRLTQIEWDESMAAIGNLGDHFDAIINIGWLAAVDPKATPPAAM